LRLNSNATSLIRVFIAFPPKRRAGCFLRIVIILHLSAPIRESIKRAFSQTEKADLEDMNPPLCFG